MNQAQKQKINVKHIDPREEVKRRPVSEEAVELSAMMRASKSTPYRYIRRGMLALVKGEFAQACSWIDYAEGFVNVFWPARSDENTAYKMSIDTARLQFLFLGEKFKELRPED